MNQPPYCSFKLLYANPVGPVGSRGYKAAFVSCTDTESLFQFVAMHRGIFHKKGSAIFINFDLKALFFGRIFFCAV
jgi:hypothetical protein